MSAAWIQRHQAAAPGTRGDGCHDGGRRPVQRAGSGGSAQDGPGGGGTVRARGGRGGRARWQCASGQDPRGVPRACGYPRVWSLPLAGSRAAAELLTHARRLLARQPQWCGGGGGELLRQRRRECHPCVVAALGVGCVAAGGRRAAAPGAPSAAVHSTRARGARSGSGPQQGSRVLHLGTACLVAVGVVVGGPWRGTSPVSVPLVVAVAVMPGDGWRQRR